MNTYERYAKILMSLHQNFSNLVLKRFYQSEEFYRGEYEANLNQEFRNRISYNEKFITGGQRIIRPCFVLYNSINYGIFGIEYRSYSGLVAFKALNKLKKNIRDGVPVEKLQRGRNSGVFWKGKHGLFDFYLHTGSRYKQLYNGDATHYNLFKDLKSFVSFEDCCKVWRGEDFYTTETNPDRLEALLTLFLLMLEQEVNYGQLDFQQYTNFKISEGFRPRDMIMGFLDMMYHNEDSFKSYPFWSIKNNVHLSPHFGFNKETEGYFNLDNKYKEHFEKYRNNYPQVKSLFDNENIKNLFIQASSKAGQNPSMQILSN